MGKATVNGIEHKGVHLPVCIVLVPVSVFFLVFFY